MSNIHVVSYNVLSSSLAKPEYYFNSPPEYIDNVYRLRKLIEKLEAEIKRQAIITLQEVSERWANELTVFFYKNEYFVSARNYGDDFNGYMGVLIAVPLELYSIEQVTSRRLSDTIYWPTDVRHERFNNRNYSAETLKTLNGAERRTNCVLMNQLLDLKANKLFLVATYHMPCKFKEPKFMDIHAGLLVRAVQEAARGMPIILSGDFNAKASSSMYRLITTGDVSPLVHSMFHNHKDPDRISFGEDIRDAKKNKRGQGRGNGKGKGKKEKIKEEVVFERGEGVGVHTKIYPMRSAYKVFSEKEPGITNFNNKTESKEGGVGMCIDYIFISEEFRVVDIQELYENRAQITSASFPDENEPSDHVMLRVSLCL